MFNNCLVKLLALSNYHTCAHIHVLLKIKTTQYSVMHWNKVSLMLFLKEINFFSISMDLDMSLNCDTDDDVLCTLYINDATNIGIECTVKNSIWLHTLCSDLICLDVVNNVRQSRLSQLISWCGGEKFDGCLIFDECHKAKNFVPVSIIMFRYSCLV